MTIEFNKSVIDLIKIRKSIRNYESIDLKQDDKKKIIDFIKMDHNTIFNCKPRFEFIDSSGLDPHDFKNLGTYGMITGVKYFIVGIYKGNNKKDYCLVDFGYVFEKIIVFITDLGLGTCWLGGTFNKKGFSEKILLKQDEVIPAISPIGIISKKRHLKSSVIRAFAGSNSRKKWDKLFFNNNFLNPLDESDAGSYKVPLEMVRIGPSASNLQPWRIVRENNIFHFFVRRSKIRSYSNMQYMDMGISLCHFDLAISELNLKGKWEVKENIQKNEEYAIPSDTDYIISWNGY